ncbi:MAG: apolipoprotein N-acyltransferase [Armatimonadetes bacterium]|nr:apolipoprotein N-acyltransferase [Armatimonadota bacterium]
MVVKNPYVRVLATVVLLALAFPPFNAFFLVFVALVPWLTTLQNSTPKQAVRLGWVFGTLFWLHQMVWMVPFVGKWTGSYALALVPYLLVLLAVVWYFPLLAWLTHRAWTNGYRWAVPLIWASVEALRSGIPSIGFPWGQLAVPLYSQPMLMQLSAFGQIFLVSAWVVCGNILVFELLEVANARKTSRWLVVFIAGFVLSGARYMRPVEGKPHVVTVGQLGVEMAFSSPAQQEIHALRSAQELLDSAAANGSELLILPEDVVPSFQKLRPEVPVSVLYGGNRSVGQRYFRSAYLDDGKSIQVADKTRLVIFGEYVPFRNSLPFLNSFNLPTGDLQAGDHPSTMNSTVGKVGPLICFEALFPDVALAMADQGAQSLAVMAIDDWYAGTPAMEQLLAQSAWRSAENGLPVFRSGSMGISAVFDARGNMVARAPYGRQVQIREEVKIPGQSDALKGRGYFQWIASLGPIFVLVAPWLKNKKARTS